MRHYDELARFERDGFDIVVDKTWEDLNPRDCFDFDEEEELFRKIEDGTYDWFMLRVRVMVEDMELACEYLGGCCYEDAKEVLTDGTVEDQLYSALAEAKTKVYGIAKRFAALSEQVDQEALQA